MKLELAPTAQVSFHGTPDSSIISVCWGGGAETHANHKAGQWGGAFQTMDAQSRQSPCSQLPQAYVHGELIYPYTAFSSNYAFYPLFLTKMSTLHLLSVQGGASDWHMGSPLICVLSASLVAGCSIGQAWRLPMAAQRERRLYRFCPSLDLSLLAFCQINPIL